MYFEFEFFLIKVEIKNLNIFEVYTSNGTVDTALFAAQLALPFAHHLFRLDGLPEEEGERHVACKNREAKN